MGVSDTEPVPLELPHSLAVMDPLKEEDNVGDALREPVKLPVPQDEAEALKDAEAVKQAEEDEDGEMEPDTLRQAVAVLDRVAVAHALAQPLPE